MEFLSSVLAHPYVAGAVSGLLAAAAVDFQAFKAWQSFNDAVEYDWSTALWRWAQGAVIGFVGATGMVALQ